MKFSPFPALGLLFIVSTAVLSFSGLSCNHDLDPIPIVVPPDTDPPKRTSVRIATFNVHELFDTTCDSGACSFSDYEEHPSPAQYSDKLQDLVTQIRSINADVVLLQEIETQTALTDLLASLGGAYVGVFGETGRSASMDVATIVRGKLIKTTLHRNSAPFVDATQTPRLLARELIEAEVEISPDWRLIVFNTHFVSKVTDTEGSRRLGEAQTTKSILDKAATQNPDSLIVFGGDLNDTPDSAPLQSLVQNTMWSLCSADIPTSQSLTWADQAAIDHLIYRAGKTLTYLPKSTRRLCNPSPVSGLGSSDHCALIAEFGPTPTLAEK